MPIDPGKLKHFWDLVLAAATAGTHTDLKTKIHTNSKIKEIDRRYKKISNKVKKWILGTRFRCEIQSKLS